MRSDVPRPVAHQTLKVPPNELEDLGSVHFRCPLILPSGVAGHRARSMSAPKARRVYVT